MDVRGGERADDWRQPVSTRRGEVPQTEGKVTDPPNTVTVIGWREKEKD